MEVKAQLALKGTVPVLQELQGPVAARDTVGARNISTKENFFHNYNHNLVPYQFIGLLPSFLKEVTTLCTSCFNVNKFVFCAQYIYMLRKMLRRCNDYIRKQHQSSCLCDGDSVCSCEAVTEFLNNARI